MALAENRRGQTAAEVAMRHLALMVLGEYKQMPRTRFLVNQDEICGVQSILATEKSFAWQHRKTCRQPKR